MLFHLLTPYIQAPVPAAGLPVPFTAADVGIAYLPCTTNMSPQGKGEKGAGPYAAVGGEEDRDPVVSQHNMITNAPTLLIHQMMQ